uniref:RNase H type-1 domain-containing protein n=1 Tax=Cannabis sativa TaxID=3483 RepID=A0A803QQD1_CANSA
MMRVAREAILSIPWPSSNMDDKLICNFEKSGWYSVKSGQTPPGPPLSQGQMNSLPSDGIGSKWSPPLAGSIKVNRDATIDKNSTCSGLGMVVCDHLGIVLTSAIWRLDGFLDPEVVEALALRNAMV